MERADLSLVQTSDGLQVVFNGRALYDDQPASSAARKAQSLPVQAQTLYLLASPVAWHGVVELLSRLPDDSAILAVEFDPVLLELAGRLTPDELPVGRVMLSAANAPSVRAALGGPAAGKAGLGRFRRVRQITFCAGALINRSRYREIREGLEQEIRIIWQNRLTLSAMGRLWVGNVIRNLPCLADAAELPALHKPVVVCGAGPSLAAAIPLLLAERPALTVCAVDTALPSLVENGITPDYVVAIEGQLANVYDFLPVGRREYALVADISSAPSVIELHDPSQIAWVSSRFAEIGLLDRITAADLPLRAIPPLGSVGVAAVQIALMLTDGPVLFTGLDFAFRPDQPDPRFSATHAPGAPVHLSRLITDRRLRHAPPADLAGRWLRRQGTDGQPVMTTLTMTGYAEQLAALVTAAAGAGRPIVVVEPFGLETGAQSVTADQAREIITRETARAPVTDAAGPSQAGPVHRRIEQLLAEELVLLARFEHQVAAASPGNDDAALEHAFELCDYVAVDFPDLPDFWPFAGELRTDRAFLTRLRVAIDFYRDRIERSLRSLRS